MSMTRSTLTGSTDWPASTSRRSSSMRRPTELPSPDHVEVEVGHAVEGVVADVEHQPVAALVDALGPRHLLGGGDEADDNVGVLVGDGMGVVDVLARNHQHVGGRGRVDV